MSLLRAPRTFLSALMMYASLVAGYPSGAPNTACPTMTPLHHGTSPSTDIHPFHVELSKNTYSPREAITLTLRSNSTDRPFRGFLIQVWSQQGPVGTFQNVQDLNSGQGIARAMCTPEKTGLTQNSNNLRTSVTSQWTAPDFGAGDLQVRVTYVERFDIYWVALISEELREEVETTAPTTTTTTPPTTTVSTTTTITTQAVVTNRVTSTTTTTTTTTTTSLPPTTTTTTTTTTTLAPTTRKDEATTAKATVKAMDVTTQQPQSRHTVIGTISMETSTPKTSSPGTRDGSSGLALHPSTLVCSGLVFSAILLLSL